MRIVRNSNQIVLVLLYIILGFSCYFFEYSSDQELNQTLNDTYISGRGLQDIYLVRCK